MNKRRLGKTGLVVSEICMGTMTFGEQCDEKLSFEIMERAFEAGIDFFDAAEMYPVTPSAKRYGVTEEIVGRWMKTKPRDSMLVATKIAGPGHGWFVPPVRHGMTTLDRHQIFRAVDSSLARLKTDYIDLYQTHWPDHGMRYEEVLEALTDLVQLGKIRAFGCSNETSWGLMKSLWAADVHGLRRYETVQNNFSLLNRRCENELAQVCRQEDVSLLPYSPLAGGVLTGKYLNGQYPAGARFSAYLDTGNDRQKAMARRFINERTLDATQRYIDIAESIGHSVTTMATAWSKQHDFVGSTIVGATSVEQLEECLLGADLVLNDETMDLLDDVEEALPNSFAEDGLRKL